LSIPGSYILWLTLSDVKGFPLDSAQLSLNNLAASNTRAASKQTYYTIRFLADRERVQHAFEAYAYFRWIDDCLDLELSSRADRLRFVARQQSLLDALSDGHDVGRLTQEEAMLAELIASDSAPESGLRIYLRHMMEVMAFDAQRRGRLISEVELAGYTRNLAVAVTENLHYFIGHGQRSPHDSTRYAAVTAAHVAHMLRDTREDVEAGYFNIPREVMSSAGIGPGDVEHPTYRAWVHERVQLAREQFRVARNYLTKVESLRCRFAGLTYMSRFGSILGLIERDNYFIRRQYPARKTLNGLITFVGSLFDSVINSQTQLAAPLRVPVAEPRKNL